MTPAERLLALLAALLLSLALLVATTGCTASLKGPVPVTLSAPLTVHADMKPRPACWVPVPPTAPELPVVDSDQQNVIDRVYIHRRTYAEMTEFAHDAALWMTQVRDCLEHWSETP